MLSHPTATATREQFQRAINRSRAHGGARVVTQVSPDSYEVAGKTGRYALTVIAGETYCDCCAGADGRLCWHVIAVGQFRLVAQMKAPVTITPVKRRPTLEELYDMQDARLAAAGVR